MLKWNEAATEAASKNEEARSERNRRQNDDFCRALRAAFFARKKSCPEGVSTEPGTKKPILHDHRPVGLLGATAESANVTAGRRTGRRSALSFCRDGYECC
jgi:hypothetical protein